MRPRSTRTQLVALSQRTPTTSKTRSVHWRPSRSRAWVIAGVHGVTSGRATRCAASDATSSLKEVDVGLAADLGILARIPKLVANELAFSPSQRARLVGESRCAALGLVSRVVPGLGADVVGTGAPPLSSPRMSCVEVWKILVAVVGTERFIADARHHSCVVFLASSTFRRMSLCFAGLVYDRLAEYKPTSSVPYRRKSWFLLIFCSLAVFQELRGIIIVDYQLYFFRDSFQRCCTVTTVFQCCENSFLSEVGYLLNKSSNRSLKIVVNFIPETNTRGVGLGRTKRGVG